MPSLTALCSPAKVTAPPLGCPPGPPQTNSNRLLWRMLRLALPIAMLEFLVPWLCHPSLIVVYIWGGWIYHWPSGSFFAISWGQCDGARGSCRKLCKERATGSVRASGSHRQLQEALQGRAAQWRGQSASLMGAMPHAGGAGTSRAERSRAGPWTCSPPGASSLCGPSSR